MSAAKLVQDCCRTIDNQFLIIRYCFAIKLVFCFFLTNIYKVV